MGAKQKHAPVFKDLIYSKKLLRKLESFENVFCLCVLLIAVIHFGPELKQQVRLLDGYLVK